jgi:hypothetical protein
MNNSAEDQNTLNSALRSAMLQATSKQYVYQFVPLIEKKADVNVEGSYKGSRPLWLAARYGSQSTVAQLIKLGADLTLRVSGYTVETWARHYKQHEIADYIRAYAAKQGAESFMPHDMSIIVGYYVFGDKQEEEVDKQPAQEKTAQEKKVSSCPCAIL